MEQEIKTKKPVLHALEAGGLNNPDGTSKEVMTVNIVISDITDEEQRKFCGELEELIFKYVPKHVDPFKEFLEKLAKEREAKNE